jgi:hypothetical protein
VPLALMDTPGNSRAHAPHGLYNNLRIGIKQPEGALDT